MANIWQIQFGLITQYFKILNSIFILINKLNRTIDFFENSLENNNLYKEKFNGFFYIGKRSEDYEMIKYEHILDKCVLLQEDNNVFF